MYRFLLEEKIDVGLATIYRVLMQFAEAGIFIRRHFESGAAMIELNEGDHHDHLVCTACGKVEEFVDNYRTPSGGDREGARLFSP